MIDLYQCDECSQLWEEDAKTVAQCPVCGDFKSAMEVEA